MKTAASMRDRRRWPAPSLLAFVIVTLAVVAAISSLLLNLQWPANLEDGAALPLGGLGAIPLPPSL
jgi:hypothetical protein